MSVTTLTVWHAPAHAQAMNNGNDIANRVTLSVACTMEMQHFGYEQLLNFWSISCKILTIQCAQMTCVKVRIYCVLIWCLESVADQGFNVKDFYIKECA